MSIKRKWGKWFVVGIQSRGTGTRSPPQRGPFDTEDEALKMLALLREIRSREMREENKRGKGWRKGWSKADDGAKHIPSPSEVIERIRAVRAANGLPPVEYEIEFGATA